MNDKPDYTPKSNEAEWPWKDGLMPRSRSDDAADSWAHRSNRRSCYRAQDRAGFWRSLSRPALLESAEN